MSETPNEFRTWGWEMLYKFHGARTESARQFLAIMIEVAAKEELDERTYAND